MHEWAEFNLPSREDLDALFRLRQDAALERDAAADSGRSELVWQNAIRLRSESLHACVYPADGPTT